MSKIFSLDSSDSLNKNIQFIISSNKAVTKINPTNCFHVLSLLSFFIITLLTIKYLQYRAQRY